LRRGVLSIRNILLAVITAAVSLSYANAAVAATGISSRVVDAGGIRLLVQKAEGGLAAVCVFVGVGSSCENPENNGVTSLVNEAILSSDPALGTSPILEIEQLGGTVEAVTGSEFSCFKLTVPLENLAPALDALGGAIASPPFSGPVLEAQKRLLLDRAWLVQDRPVELGYKYFLRESYPDSPYGLHPDGEPASLKRLKAGDVTGWHERYYVRGNVLVSLCADIEQDAAVRMVGRAFGGMKAGPSGTAVLSGRCKPADGRMLLPDTSGCVALVGYPAPPAGSPDYPAMKLAQAVVAQGMGSMLFKALRVDDKLAYSFGSILPPLSSGSRLVFYVNADPHDIDRAVKCVEASVDSLKRGELTAAELARAKGIAGSELRLKCESQVGLAWRGGLAAMLGLDAGYWDVLSEAISSQGTGDVVKAARKYMDGCTVVIMKPAAGG
jgi:zinc protease